MKKTKKSLIFSLISLILCFSMLVGSTFAWFTDSVTSASNIITAGNLDVKMYWSNDLTNWNDIEGENNKVFDYDNWEPGYTEVKYLKIQNNGSLAFKYTLNLLALGEVGKLAEVIDVYYGETDTKLVDRDLSSLTKRNGTLKELISGEGKLIEGVLLPAGKSDANNNAAGEIIVAIALHMQESAGNEYQKKSVGDGFTVQLLATQYSFEEDAYGSDYDNGATYPAGVIKYSASQSVSSVVDATDNKLTTDVVVGDKSENIYADVPTGVKMADGSDSLTLSVNTIENSKANVTLAENEVATSLDVHVEGIAADNTVPVQVTLKGLVQPGLNDNNIKLYHVENGVTVQMTLVTLAELDAHNEFYYNAATGDVIVSMASFSEVAVVAEVDGYWDGVSANEFAGGTGTEADPYIIANASQLAYFRDLVDGGKTFEGEFVKLANNIFLNHEGEFKNLFDPIGWGYSYAGHNSGGAAGKVFKGTFDGDYYSIHGLWQNGWDLETKTGTDYTYTNCGAGLFASVENATIKNLGLIDAIVTYECVEAGLLVGLAQGNCTFDTILVFDSKIANYQRPAGGIVGEVSPSRNDDGTAIDSTHTFKNIVLDTSVVVGSLWGDFDTPVGGVIGARWDDDNVTDVVMNNVKVACELDVYNDVTSTYQWYAYRRAGMLIGNTDTPPADGKNSKVATADFLTCTEVYVYYTNWAKYNYCQFSNHNSSWPWVRVQAGENCEAYSNPRYGVPNDVNGNKVVDYNHVHQEGDQCNVQIYFNQLYGGGQGVYGQPEHEGVNTNVKYLITFMQDDHVAAIRFITDNSSVNTVELPDTSLLPHLDQSKTYEWLDRNGIVVSADNNNNTIPAGNIRDIFYYLTETDKYYAHFVDKDGFYVDQIEFDPDTGKFLGEKTEPAVPAVPGYNGIWEPYTLLGAEHDVIINAVYSKSETATVLTTAEQMFESLGEGYDLSMSQDLDGKFGSSNQDVFCTVVTNPDVAGDYEARFDLNSFTLHYTGDAGGNKDWTLFHILGAEGDKPASKLTVGNGIAGFGFLYFDLTKLNSNASPCIFYLEEGATLVLERGVVIEFRYPQNNGNTIYPFKGVSDYTDSAKYPGLKIEHDTAAGVYRITVTARTVLVGDGTAEASN